MFTAAPSYYYNSRGTASAGYAYKYWAGYPDDGTWQTNRAFLHFDNMFANLPEDAEIESAELVLYEYVDLSGGTTAFEVYKLNSSCTFDEVDVSLSQSWRRENSPSLLSAETMILRQT